MILARGERKNKKSLDTRQRTDERHTFTIVSNEVPLNNLSLEISDQCAYPSSVRGIPLSSAPCRSNHERFLLTFVVDILVFVVLALGMRQCVNQRVFVRSGIVQSRLAECKRARKVCVMIADQYENEFGGKTESQHFRLLTLG